MDTDSWPDGRQLLRVSFPALVFPAAELLGLTEFGLLNAVLMALMFVVFTVVFQRSLGRWS